MFSDIEPEQRYRLVTEFTRRLTDLCREHCVVISGGQVIAVDDSWNGPDAEKWEQYALNQDDALVSGFWNQHARVIER